MSHHVVDLRRSDLVRSSTERTGPPHRVRLRVRPLPRRHGSGFVERADKFGFEDRLDLVMLLFELVSQRRVKKWALKKMVVQFNGYKKKLDTLFVKEKKTPDFNGPYEKIKDHWEEFVKYKTSERAKKRSVTNKKNAANKMHFHTMGQGGYKAGRPKWEKWENDLIGNGIHQR
ncbi:hypothetical protein QYE76_048714 [Lolium multiflorum]|uniref:Uncharacterized protein n=1 Tax=Lolium multiflorum TaxID=4521 RepID=A0AAD8SMQ4_LOLMU|nr:hypothetical protein QYE76_048714 [Lolium multiflorum]